MGGASGRGVSARRAVVGVALAALVASGLTNGANAVAANGGVYGCTGNDGTITRSSNTAEANLIEATTYTVNSGVTITSTGNDLYVCATVAIIINGTISLNGAGGTAGAAGQTGGFGFSSTNGRGNPGGIDGPVSGGSRAGPVDFAALLSQYPATAGGAGGGGGGTGTCAAAAHSGGSGAGGARAGGNSGGSGASSGVGGTDGAGGAGGGILYLSAPSITINGHIASNGTNGVNAIGTNCGAGGGGSGGIIYENAQTLTVASGTHEWATGGNGGNGGGSGGAGAAGGAGGIEDVAGSNGSTPTTGGGGGGGGSGGIIVRRISGVSDSCSSCESQTHANSTWESQTHANSTWESQAHANATWESQAHANATWCPLVGGSCSGAFSGTFTGTNINVTWENATYLNVTYLTAFDAEIEWLNATHSPFEGAAHANATWCPYSCITTSEDWTNLTNSRQDAFGNATWESQAHANATWCPLTGAGCAVPPPPATSGNFTGNFTGNVTIPPGGSVDGVLSFDASSSTFFGDITIAKLAIMIIAFVAFLWTARLHWYFLAVVSWLIIIQQLFVGASPFGPNATFMGLLVLWLVMLFVYVVIEWGSELRAAAAGKAVRHRGDRG